MWLVHLCCVITSFLVNMLFLKIKSGLFIIRLFFQQIGGLGILDFFLMKASSILSTSAGLSDSGGCDTNWGSPIAHGSAQKFCVMTLTDSCFD
jgi:hypothetical protein